MKTPEQIKAMKNKEKIAVLTAYGYPIAKILDESDFDIILVGDSLGMVVLGYETTKQVTMQDIIRHTNAVANGAKNTLIIADLPINSYNTEEEAIKNARLLLEAGAHAVKPEGKSDIVKALAEQNIPVMGHIGLLPQTQAYKVKGKDEEEAKNLINEAKEMEKAGAFSMVIESVPTELAKKITESVNIPTIGIGAGKYCDGQVLVINDMLGFYDKLKPKFVKQYADLWNIIKKAVSEYRNEVKEGKFPSEEHSYK